jgi:hypothetical protein
MSLYNWHPFLTAATAALAAASRVSGSIYSSAANVIFPELFEYKTIAPVAEACVWNDHVDPSAPNATGCPQFVTAKVPLIVIVGEVRICTGN